MLVCGVGGICATCGQLLVFSDRLLASASAYNLGVAVGPRSPCGRTLCHLPWRCQLEVGPRTPELLYATHTLDTRCARVLVPSLTADKDNKFWFSDPLLRSTALSWIFFEQAGPAPMQGQAHQFL